MNSSKPQVIIIGSGINSLVCAALLSIWGKSVLVLERNAVLGGCIRTEELFPGYIHDVLSCWYPLFLSSPAYQVLKPELEKAGVEFIQSDYSTGLVQTNGRGIALKRGVLPAALQLDEIAGKDGEAFRYMVQQILHDDAELVFSLLGQNPYGFSVLRLLFNEWRKRGIDGLVEFAGHSLETFRRWSERELQSDFIRTLIAPWALHTGLGPDDASSALIGKLTFAAVVAGGMPVVKGGSISIVEALKMIIEQYGGQLLTHTNVDHIITHQRGRKYRASGVIAGERVYHATDAVVCNVTPQQLYGHLLDNVPQTVQQYAQGYRYGRGGMQVHFALNSPPSWSDPKLCHVPLIHLAESMQEICLSVTQANNGYLPEHPTLAIGQPVALDPGRAPEGGWILWIQMQELPTHLKGDALGEIPIPEDGKWNDAVREAFADRVQARLERVIPGFSSTIVGRRAYSPADLQTLNCNLVGGDPYSGICTPDQFFWLRPFASSKRTKAHQTFICNVFHIGASAHPGPGLAGTSGYLVARRLARH
ncbi:phytoene desaturase family protein [Xenorhabdus sp. KK7.4]|uniref:phytoene desaturase family protein n=1 Tax=Xenorhabdus sp. KK7.4 TaxID=1851572 RepID=UPI000C03DE94|nr:NAD(P)/FAD-dependent oxidoreductase [Xenorhabdus sp. KK7.4]PHM54485.1 membrane protein [Xenorhabdus sp. KK7.4]